jgi:hypothetical protein
VRVVGKEIWASGMKGNGRFCSICAFSGRQDRPEDERAIQNRKNCFKLLLASLFFKPNSELLSKQHIVTSLCLKYLISLSMRQ